MVNKKSRFGEELDRILESQGKKQKDLADKIATSTAYVSSIATGKRNVSPGRATAIGEALGADVAQMSRLHRAAALDAGFRLDLPEDFDE